MGTHTHNNGKHEPKLQRIMLSKTETKAKNHKTANKKEKEKEKDKHTQSGGMTNRKLEHK